MQSTGAKIAVAVGAVAIIVVLFVVLSGKDDKKKSTTTTTTTQTITGASGATGTTKTKPVVKTKTVVLKDGKPVGGVVKLDFDKGERVRFLVKSDADGEIHIHGYDITKPVDTSKNLKVSFPATIDGVFEIEDHDSGEQIAELTVNP